jgi:hypothetical protein
MLNPLSMTIVIPCCRGFSNLSGICVSLKFILVLLDPLKNVAGSRPVECRGLSPGRECRWLRPVADRRKSSKQSDTSHTGSSLKTLNKGIIKKIYSFCAVQ